LYPCTLSSTVASFGSIPFDASLENFWAFYPLRGDRGVFLSWRSGSFSLWPSFLPLLTPFSFRSGRSSFIPYVAVRIYTNLLHIV
jgi:hypothetical protein